MGWTQKWARFGIEEPWLRLLTARFESQLPWLRTVRDEAGLSAHVREVLLPELEASLGKRRFAACHGLRLDRVDVAAVLAQPEGLTAADRQALDGLMQAGGVVQAQALLAERVNERKRNDFGKWRAMLRRDFGDHPAFAVLVLRALLDQFGRKVRRSPGAPDRAVLSWLLRRGLLGQIQPTEALLELYFARLARQSGQSAGDGWTLVPAGAANVRRLTALARGSGWCVASAQWADHYLTQDSFFLMHQAGAPVVALRVNGSTVVECQGRHNTVPSAFVDAIRWFVHAYGLVLAVGDRLGREWSPPFDAADPMARSWWRARLYEWPFALPAVPEPLRAGLRDDALRRLPHYAGWPGFADMAAANFPGATDDVLRQAWLSAIAAAPALHDERLLPAAWRAAVRAACLQGWVAAVQSDDLLESDLGRLPAWVSAHPDFQLAMQQFLPASIVRHAVRRRATHRERLERVALAVQLPPNAEESASLATARVAEAILHHESSEFDDESLFPEAVRQRSDFAEVRRAGWQMALEARPTVFFAVPADLRLLPEFAPHVGPAPGRKLGKWVDTVRERPWVLEWQGGVPKMLRRHIDILHAYRDFWCDRVRRDPSRLWVQIGSGNVGSVRRVYMAYTLLADAKLQGALRMGFLFDPVARNRASDRMHQIPAVQRALGARAVRLPTPGRTAVVVAAPPAPPPEPQSLARHLPRPLAVRALPRPVVESPRARELRLELIPAARRLLERAQVAPPIDDADIRRQMSELGQWLDELRREGVRDAGLINEVAAQLGVLHAQRRALEREVVQRRAELVRQLEAELADLSAAER